MIEISNLNKFYGKLQAIKDLSFHVNPGELVGFIGPNGSGKTTTFKCLTTLSRPTSGEIVIDGINIKKAPEKIRSFIGYLPEETPLIDELTVKEYLKFRYSLKTITKGKSRSVIDSINLCGLKDVQNKVIYNLSKGFRQRVGIAESILGSPRILLLDEPANGLDPEQIINIRQFLTELKNDHTLIVSSHILSELELTCDRFIMISNGELKAYGTKDEILKISSKHSRIELEVSKTDDSLIEKLKTIPEVIEIEKETEGSLITLSVSNGSHDLRERISQIVNENSNLILTLNWIKPNLESLYMELCRD